MSFAASEHWNTNLVPADNMMRSCTDCSSRSRIARRDRKSTRLNSSHDQISYAVFCLKKKKKIKIQTFSDTIERKKTNRKVFDNLESIWLLILHQRFRIALVRYVIVTSDLS